MRYLLDTNVFIAAMKGVDAVRMRLEQVTASDLVVSPVVLGELELGVRKSAQPAANRKRLASVLAQLAIEPINALVAQSYGEIRADLEATGQPIGANDIWIAAHARSLGATLVTDNTREFSRVNALRLENWLRPA